MTIKKLIPHTVLLLAGAIGAQAQTTLIDANTLNGSFELAGGSTNTSKINTWDGATDIDNWTVWGEVSTAGNDSGVEASANATDGEMIGYMQPGNAVYNLTGYTAQVGDVFEYSFDFVDRGSSNPYSLTFDLVFEDSGNGNAITQVNDSSAIVLSGVTTDGHHSGSYTVQSGDAIVGMTVGVGFLDAVNYPNFDNVTLSVTAVPEPSTYALIAGAMALGAIMIRRRKL